MDNLNQVISDNLKKLREQRKLSLDAVSRLCGVSKSMLGQIERGEVNPTISTVWKITNGLKISYGDLLSRPEAECEVVEIGEMKPLLEDGGHFRNYTVFPSEDGRRFEMQYIEMDPGSHLEAEAHPFGTQEFVTVFSGELSVFVNNETYTAGNCGSIRFKADRPHQYRNTGDEICRLSMIIYYPAL